MENDIDVRSGIAHLLTHRCNNCYRRLPGSIGCDVHSPGWNWITGDFGPFCDECIKETGWEAVKSCCEEMCRQRDMLLAACKSALKDRFCWDDPCVDKDPITNALRSAIYSAEGPAPDPSWTPEIVAAEERTRLAVLGVVDENYVQQIVKYHFPDYKHPNE